MGIVPSTLVSALTHSTPPKLPQQQTEPSPLFPAGKPVEELPIPNARVQLQPASEASKAHRGQLEAGSGVSEHKEKFGALSLACFFGVQGTKHPLHLGTASLPK